MKTITAFVLALALLVTPAAFAQRGQGNSHGHDNSHGRGNGGARSGRDGHFNRDRHGRIDHDVRIVGGRREVFFDGFWFGCDLWPEFLQSNYGVMCVSGSLPSEIFLGASSDNEPHLLP